MHTPNIIYFNVLIKSNNIQLNLFYLFFIYSKLIILPFYTHTDGTVPPISLTKDKQMIRGLLKHGANPQNAYSYHRKALGKVFSKDPLSNPVKILVIGNGGEGKSTLIEAMKIEPSTLKSFKNIIICPS